MCLAVPWKVVAVKKGYAIVQYGKEKRRAKIMGGVKPRVGDFVLVQARIVAQILKKKAARESLKTFSLLKAVD